MSQNEVLSVSEKVAVITGGIKGIGKNTAQLLVESGMRVAVTYRKSSGEAEQLVKDLKKTHGIECMAIRADSANSDDCKDAVSQILDKFGCIDILIHNAGPYIHERKNMVDYTSSEWNYMINGNLNGLFYLAKEIIPYMREKRWGRVITFGFERSETAPGWIYRSAFAAAKSGLTSLTRTLALEEAANGITVNMVCPGDIIGSWKESGIELARKFIDESVPVGRPGTGEDIARVIAFLCEEKSDFITGTIIPVTGGKDVLGKIFQD
jgi:3-oxoacyl-[acyl-carrier protein] reductase